jgi:hypothetical protein
MVDMTSQMVLSIKDNSINKTSFKVFIFIYIGNGILYYPSGNIFYSGNWYKNMFHGYGILNNVPNNQ